MRYFGICSLLFLTFLCGFARADVTINLTAGVLENASGLAIPDGALVQILIDTGSNGFSAPTATSFTGGSSEDVILDSFAMNSSTSDVAGSFLLPLTFSGSNLLTFGSITNIAVGDSLLLRWWPTLTTTSSDPGLNTTYGQFTSTSLLDGSQIAWSVPSGQLGGNDSLNFKTTGDGGTQSPSAGLASNTVTAVPEPSSFLLTGFGLAAMIMIARSRQRCC